MLKTISRIILLCLLAITLTSCSYLKKWDWRGQPDSTAASVEEPPSEQKPAARTSPDAKVPPDSPEKEAPPPVTTKTPPVGSPEETPKVVPNVEQIPRTTETAPKETVKIEYLHPPEPALPKERKSPDVPASTIMIPVNIPLDQVLNLKEWEAALPRSEDFSASWQNFPDAASNYAIKYKWERDNFTIEGLQDQVLLRTRINYQFTYAEKTNRMYPPFTCCVWNVLETCEPDETRPQVESRIVIRYTMDENWKLKATTAVFSERKKGCEQVQVANAVLNRIKTRWVDPLSLKATLMDEQVKNTVDIRPQAELAWNKLHEPIAIDQGGTAWLMLHPRKARVTPVRIEGNLLTLNIGIEAYPEIKQGRKPKVVRKPLPEILLGTPEPGLHLLVSAMLPHTEAVRDLSEKLVGHTFSFKNGRKVKIRKVKIYGNSIKMVVRLDAEGDYNGSLYLSGRPQYDSVKQRIALPDLDFDLKTRDWLSGKADWILTDQLPRALREHSQWALSDKIDTALQSLKKTINTSLDDKLRFSGEIKDSKQVAIRANRNSLLTVFAVEGELKFLVS